MKGYYKIVEDKMEKIKSYFFEEIRNLKQEEKFKSTDYWEGYTKAVSELARIIYNKF